jgi:hypothetical protein
MGSRVGGREVRARRALIAALETRCKNRSVRAARPLAGPKTAETSRGCAAAAATPRLRLACLSTPRETIHVRDVGRICDETVRLARDRERAPVALAAFWSAGPQPQRLAHAMQPARRSTLRRSGLMQHAPTLQRKETLRWLNCLVIASLAAGSTRAFHTWHQLEGSLAGRTTYAFDAATSNGAPTPGARHPLEPDEQHRIRDELRRHLAARGYTATRPDEARLLLSYSGGRPERTTRGEPARRARSPAAVSASACLAVHLVDPRSRVVLWRGWGDGELGPYAEDHGPIAEAVRRITAALPAARA